MKVILAALAGAAVTATGAALAGPTSRPVTQAQLSSLTKRVAALESSNAQLVTRASCLAAQYNDQSAEPYLVQGWGGFDSKSGFVDLFMAPSADDGLNATGYIVTLPKPITAYTKC